MSNTQQLGPQSLDNWQKDLTAREAALADGRKAFDAVCISRRDEMIIESRVAALAELEARTAALAQRERAVAAEEKRVETAKQQFDAFCEKRRDELLAESRAEVDRGMADRESTLAKREDALLQTQRAVSFERDRLDALRRDFVKAVSGVGG